MKSKAKNGKFMSSVKVGPKGQIVIPKEVRQMFDISPGDILVLLADSEKGIALEKYSTFEEISNAIFAGNAKKIYPNQSEEASIEFANAIKEVGNHKNETNLT